MTYQPTQSEQAESAMASRLLQKRYHLTLAQAELWLDTGEKEASPEAAREALRSYRAVWEEDTDDGWEGTLVTTALDEVLA